jgi:hypothetical protein
MGASQKTATEAVVLNYSDNSPNDGFRKLFGRTRRQFEGIFRELLEYAGLTAGNFGIILSTLAKGRGQYTQGLIIGTPLEGRRTVELFWQGEGNDSRIQMFVSAPHGLTASEFHRKLVAAYDKYQDVKKTSKKEKRDEKPTARVIKLPATIREVVMPQHIELVMAKLCQVSPEFGFVDVDTCLEALEEFGDAQNTLDMLVLERYLELMPGSDRMYVIPEKLRTKFAELSETVAPPVEMVQVAGIEAPAQPAPASSLMTTLAQLKDCTELVRQAEERKKLLQNVEQEEAAIKAFIAETEALIAGKVAELGTLALRRQEFEEFLTNPELKKAEETIAAFEAVLRST